MILLPTTLCLAAAAGVITLWLGGRIGQTRHQTKIFVGDGGNEALQRRMRAQLNFVEFTPFMLLLVIAIELSGRGGLWLPITGGIYMLARVAHGFGMDAGKDKLRGIGTGITMLTLLGYSIAAVWIAVGK